MTCNRQSPVCTILRIFMIPLCMLCLAGCFDFNKTFPSPTASFQIIVSSPSYGGTYLWSAQDSAYEALAGGSRYYIYTDSSNFWCIANQLGQTHDSGSIAHSISQYGALPPTSGSGWSSDITGIDDSFGGVSQQGSAPDAGVSGGYLQASFSE
jgi:hypothetical protein